MSHKRDEENEVCSLMFKQCAFDSIEEAKEYCCDYPALCGTNTPGTRVQSQLNEA
jgi:hypothetical protein